MIVANLSLTRLLPWQPCCACRDAVNQKVEAANDMVVQLYNL